MSIVLPSLTTFDPETSSEGTLDPLGLYLIADQLATKLVPAVRERMQRIRFLTVMAVGAVLSEELEWKAGDSACEPWLVWEWLVVEALLRSPTIAPELRGVPGTLVTKRALRSHQYLDERSYLKTPRIFGFHGVYKRLAIHLGLVDVHMNPQASAEELVQAWARDHGWLTRQEVNQVFEVWRTGLRLHISNEVEKRSYALARRRLAASGQTGVTDEAIDELVAKVQRSYFDDVKTTGRQVLDEELSQIVDSKLAENRGEAISALVRDELVDIMRRFMRVSTTLVRAFPIHQLETVNPAQAVKIMLNHEDGSKFSWRRKFEAFIDFFVRRCSSAEREGFLEAARRTSTGAIRIKVDETLTSEQVEGKDGFTMTLANVQEATGLTDRDQRTRLMRSFNTPFFPDILVCSEVMGEGVDLHRYCRNVIHHDLAWNPSQIEQRTGRVDRLGCKAENRHSIHVYLPYVAGASTNDSSV